MQTPRSKLLLFVLGAFAAATVVIAGDVASLPKRMVVRDLGLLQRADSCGSYGSTQCGGGCTTGQCCDEAAGIVCEDNTVCTLIGGITGCCPVGKSCDKVEQCHDYSSTECGGDGNGLSSCCPREKPHCNTDTHACVAEVAKASQVDSIYYPPPADTNVVVTSSAPLLSGTAVPTPTTAYTMDTAQPTTFSTLVSCSAAWAGYTAGYDSANPSGRNCVATTAPVPVSTDVLPNPTTSTGIIATEPIIFSTYSEGEPLPTELVLDTSVPPSPTDPIFAGGADIVGGGSNTGNSTGYYTGSNSGTATSPGADPLKSAGTRRSFKAAMCLFGLGVAFSML